MQNLFNLLSNDLGEKALEKFVRTGENSSDHEAFEQIVGKEKLLVTMF